MGVIMIGVIRIGWNWDVGSATIKGRWIDCAEATPMPEAISRMLIMARCRRLIVGAPLAEALIMP
jgi:hypothetical protein